MTVIDQRILIPTGPDAVWAIVSDLSQNPKWQSDCQAISFLTSMRTGPKTRWRSTDPSGRECVIEITTWYEGLGYEYIYVDGVPFRESKGTLRLQEIPEGTVVQWTLNYELGGMVAGLRDSLAVRRSFRKDLIDSLKNLYTYVKESGATRQSHEARSLMRDALDYEARAQYVPRHPSRYTEREAEMEREEESAPQPVVQPAVPIPEPPVSDEDTKPHPAVAGSVPEPASAEAAPAIPEPLRADEWDTPTDSGDLLRFRRPSQAEGSPVESVPAPEPPAPEESPEMPAVEAQAVVRSEEAEVVVPEAPHAAEVEAPPTPQAADSAAESAPEEPPAEPQPLPSDTQLSIARRGDGEFAPLLDTSKLDTKEISIWQVFGVTPPSETDRMKAITEEQLAAAEAEAAPRPVELPIIASYPSAALLSAETRPGAALILLFGFRIRARRALIKLRRRH